MPSAEAGEVGKRGRSTAGVRPDVVTMHGLRFTAPSKERDVLAAVLAAGEPGSTLGGRERPLRVFLDGLSPSSETGDPAEQEDARQDRYPCPLGRAGGAGSS